MLRCAAIWEDTDGRYYARAKIVDAEGGGNYDVWVVDVQLIDEFADGSGVVRSNPDRDGGFDVQDLARTSAIDPCSYGRTSFAVRATFYWRGPVNDSETWKPDISYSFGCPD
ncbi:MULTISPECIES: hypothetical protein [Saccharothrix]|uniref:hypothetical protein n=1 Tax=Saccharothrix TaxID=2071 RepID=UPI00093EC08C|nr:hypothetical protein [Saccharothrix sp. CB00851]OKI20275.1 hypothetical protein A6A25_38055 [Saccharothrix sp. CB00851]